MNYEHIVCCIVIIFLLLYLLCRNKSKENKKGNTYIYNPFVITKNQTRKITEIMNKKMEENMDDNKWISDDIQLKKCYNSCKANYTDDYIKCIKNCKKYENFNKLFIQ